MKTANQEVAERIVAALKAEDILLEESCADLAGQLATGRVGSSNWVTLLLMDSINRKEHEKDKAPEA